MFVKLLAKFSKMLYLLGCSLLSRCCSGLATWSCYITASPWFSAWCWHANGE